MKWVLVSNEPPPTDGRLIHFRNTILEWGGCLRFEDGDWRHNDYTTQSIMDDGDEWLDESEDPSQEELWDETDVIYEKYADWEVIRSMLMEKYTISRK